MHPHDGCARAAPSRPHYDLGEIFRAHGEAYRARYPLSPEQAKVMRAIEDCRTCALGGHLDVCLDCGFQRPAYNSCRNRHCPKCQALDQHRWLEQRRQRILPVPYFHVVFTLPGELAPLALRNRRLVYELLLRSAAQTLLTLGKDPERLGARLGLTMVLHTWTRDLRYHLHSHAIVTGGGLSFDDTQWVAGDPNYLFPVKVIGRLFRGKFLHFLARAHQQQQLDVPERGLEGEFDSLCSRLYNKDWVVYAKRPFAGPEQVFAYLGRYTHRVALSNHRLLEVTDSEVTLATRGSHSVTLAPEELIRRFLLHVLPDRFVKIRHYGLMASANVNTRLELAQRLLSDKTKAESTPARPAQSPADDWRQLLERLTGIDSRCCPACGSSRFLRLPLQPTPSSAAMSARSPPATTGAAAA